MAGLVVLESCRFMDFFEQRVGAGKALNLAGGRVRIKRSALQTRNRQLQEKQQ
jgi:hypothetical protein